jgi:hypothetical protein
MLAVLAYTFAQSQEDQAARTPDVMRRCQHDSPDQTRIISCLGGRRESLMAHKFNTNSRARLGSLRSAVRGPYEIRHLIPTPDREPDDSCFPSRKSAANRAVISKDTSNGIDSDHRRVASTVWRRRVLGSRPFLVTDHASLKVSKDG